jgi:hypothetical protein
MIALKDYSNRARKRGGGNKWRRPAFLRTSISLVVYSPLQKHSDADENAMLILLVYDADYIIKQD